MVDSYEIYGENLQDDSEVEVTDEMVRISNKRGKSRGKTSSGKPGGFERPSDDILVSGEQIIEPSKMMKNEYNIKTK
jgi:hypothetical protein|tara:strand:- start:1694 stop:1924 length:231 start_codon:yes stop_codon:yes gene_type:complete